MSVAGQRQPGDGVLTAALHPRARRQVSIQQQQPAEVLELRGREQRIEAEPDIAALVGLAPARAGGILTEGDIPAPLGRRQQCQQRRQPAAVDVQRQQVAAIIAGSGCGQGDGTREVRREHRIADRAAPLGVLLAGGRCLVGAEPPPVTQRRVAEQCLAEGRDVRSRWRGGLHSAHYRPSAAR